MNPRSPTERSNTSGLRVADLQQQQRTSKGSRPKCAPELRVALLTGGGDKPYALGLATALANQAVLLDFIGSDDLAVPELLRETRINFLNLRGDQRSSASAMEKRMRVLRYYRNLLGYAAVSTPRIFHLLWNNKFQIFDRTFLMLYYRVLGKRLLLTAHNVNAGKRDRNDSLWNRLSLKIQYRMSDHIFVHTEKMKSEMSEEFGIGKDKISVIPFGINNTVPDTVLSRDQAKERLGLERGNRTILFFGNIAPYKGLHYLVAAFLDLVRSDDSYRLVIAGKPKGSEEYWAKISCIIDGSGKGDRIIQKIQYIPDDETEVYFKAADVLVLPYTQIFQSGVLFLGYAFGLPVIAADVGSLKDDILEGETGFVCETENATELARTVRRYFGSPLFRDLDRQRVLIKQFAKERYSWSKVAAITTAVYAELLK